MIIKVTNVCERRVKVFYPADSYCLQGFRPEAIPEKVLLDAPCDDIENAKALKERVIVEEKQKKIQKQVGQELFWRNPDDIQATMYWKLLESTDEVIG